MTIRSEVCDKACKLYSEGLSEIEVGNELGISHRSVGNILSRRGLEVRKSKGECIGIDKICDAYLSGKSTPQIEKEFNISSVAVGKILKKNGIEVRDRKIEFNDDEIKQIVKEHESGMTMKDISDLHGKTKHWCTISRRLNKLGFKVDKHREMPISEYAVDDTVFDEINEESAYWIGFLMADGCVRDGGRIILALQLRDKEHVVKFRSFLKSNHKIREDVELDVERRIYPKCGISVTSKRLVERLIYFGVTPRKSHTAKVNDELAFNRHFWRGVIDGDGTVGMGQKTLYARLSLVGSKFLLEQFQTYVKSICPECDANIRPQVNIFRYALGCGPAIEIIKNLYQDSNVHLDRKKERANTLIWLYNLRPGRYCKQQDFRDVVLRSVSESVDSTDGIKEIENEPAIYYSQKEAS